MGWYGSNRLGLDRVDIALIHDPDDHGEQALREAYTAWQERRAELLDTPHDYSAAGGDGVLPVVWQL